MKLWLFSLIMASLSCVLAPVALWWSYRARKLLEGASARSLLALSAEVSELTYQFESLRSQHKRLNARVGMREARAKLEESDDGPPDSGGPVGDKPLPREKLKEIARARGHKVQ